MFFYAFLTFLVPFIVLIYVLLNKCRDDRPDMKYRANLSETGLAWLHLKYMWAKSELKHSVKTNNNKSVQNFLISKAIVYFL